MLGSALEVTALRDGEEVRKSFRGSLLLHQHDVTLHVGERSSENCFKSSHGHRGAETMRCSQSADTCGVEGM